MDKPNLLRVVLRRINANEIFALLFIVGYFAYLFYYTEMAARGWKVAENQLLNILLGVLSTCLVLIVQYYFRQKPTYDTIEHNKKAES